MYSDNESDVSIVSNEELPWPLGLDKPSREFSCQLATGLLLRPFQISPVCPLSTEEMTLLECQRADHGTCLRGSPVHCASVFLTSSAK